MQGYTHIIGLFINVWLCKKIRNKIEGQVIEKQKVSLRAYATFVLSVIFLLGFNQIFFFYTEKPNLYEQIQCPRSISLSQIKKFGDDIKIKIMTSQNIPLQAQMSSIAKLQEIINILSHPARRLTYDSFGLTGTEYAWAFTRQDFLLQIVIQSAIFYVICTIMCLVNSKKSEIKITLKTEILVMILMFVWEIDLIMTTESRLHGNYTDFLDNYYFAFPMFERRQILKSMLIPAMNMVDIFVIFFIKNSSIKKIKQLGVHPELRLITNSVSSQIQIQTQNVDFNILDETVATKIQQIKEKDEFKTEVFRLNRQLVKCLFILNLSSILPTPDIRRIHNYFRLPFIRQVGK